MDKIYKKVGGRYVPIGVHCNIDYLTDGLWYVTSKEYSKGVASIPYIDGIMKVCDRPVAQNLSELCGLHDIAENVLDDPDFRKAVLDNKNGYSISDVVHATVAIMKKMADERKKDQK